MLISSPITTDNNWDTLFEDKALVAHLNEIVFPAYLQERRWFAAKTSTLKQVGIDKLLPFPFPEAKEVYLLVIEVIPDTGLAQQYFLPIMFVYKQDEAQQDPQSLITPIIVNGENGWLADALYSDAFRQQLFFHLLHNDEVNVGNGALKFLKGSVLKQLDDVSDYRPTSKLLGVDQSNTSIVYDNRFFLKIYRRLFRDPNPDSEITYFLTERAGFKYSPRFAGSITWKRKKTYDVSVALMQERIENKGDAWPFMLNHILSFFKRLEEKQIDPESIEQIKLLRPLKISRFSENLIELIGFDVLKSIQLLSLRTAQMHIALSSDMQDVRFTPSDFNGDYTVWLKNRLLYQFDTRCTLVEQSLSRLSGLALEHAREFLRLKTDIINRILSFDELYLTSRRIRIHGDYHLGQVLVTPDNDFCILDFEGEPENTIHDRKVKQSPLKDVAGMLRSFHYAIYATIFNEQSGLTYPRKQLFAAGEKYYAALVAVFMNTYLHTAHKNRLDIGYLPEVKYLLEYCLLEKAVYELGYELNFRPTWAIIPLQGVMQLLKK
ncbi:MAG: trehalose synthase [Sphingobacteriales bacterium]|nr:MAG: trehalose synthase [Sphingobacteriales bacterium]